MAAPSRNSLARSFTVRCDRTVFTFAPPISRWIMSTLAQNRTTWPDRVGPSQNCFPASCMFPDGGTIRSSSTGPPAHDTGAATAPSADFAASSSAVFAVGARTGGSHSSSSSRCSSGMGVNRSAGVTGSSASSAWCGRSALYWATNPSTAVCAAVSDSNGSWSSSSSRRKVRWNRSISRSWSATPAGSAGG